LVLMTENVVCSTPEETLALGSRIARSLEGGELILLTGGLGAGKTLLTKGILGALDFDIDEVTSPSFTLVNLYHANFDVYHIDLWRLDDGSDAAMAVGLDEILEDDKVVVIIEWSERLKRTNFRSKVIKIDIAGEGDDPRQIKIES
jgi:tRNA threonylcarbamoyladenosine biosynthesis protein TsaE